MNNNRLVAVLMSACVAMLAQPAVAAKGFNYTYMEGGYRNLDADSIEADGFEAGLKGGPQMKIGIRGGESAIISTTWHPQFGLSQPNQCLEVVFKGPRIETVFSW